MDISLFDYEIDSSLIAQKPCFPRDESRLLSCLNNDFQDLKFKDLPMLLNSDDVLVINNTEVIPSRLFGKRDQVNIEVTLHLNIDKNRWRAFLKPGRKCQVNDELIFQNNLKANIIEKFEAGDVLLDFNCHKENLLVEIKNQGEMPLPPYIKRHEKSIEDIKDYQTIFAAHQGAVAAPTAGLHFTDNVIKNLENKGVQFAPITLHVGAGTFLPVKSDNILEHKMHEEWCSLSQKSSDILNNAIQNNKRIISVGTTCLRVLETIAKKNKGKIIPWSGFTDLFITPGFKFNIVDILITNFHLPKSTLLMLISAFHGRKRVFKSYEYAIRQKYRFFSYGDSCIFSKENQKYDK
ncbi:tRNA preQ1(34) S-adenosylmethionine ribosyltransferase-isomerase QueA [Candidatus Levibacter sp. Uisw_134_01]|uniref:tRNA preQ1(34) S-adenosylmethionine ribosyltransferase-isomerase QueA n=1 Tax=Candidatus Levibacter sp. Uisw_134_01 TaxID=3230999 RepID=UPI001DA0DE34|nr:tRNA preQ1(34) S-adenosylmethionine ribosyltransferase-isomerase QueA [Alphaproteobacteria bacterium]